MKITIHCTASANGKPYTLTQCKNDHKARGFKTIGYHYLISPTGRTEAGRNEEETGAHVEGHNDHNLGIALVGTDRFSPQQFSAMRVLLDDLTHRLSIMPWEIYCHYEWDTAKTQGKTCPNIRSVNLLSWYLMSNDEAIKDYLL